MDRQAWDLLVKQHGGVTGSKTLPADDLEKQMGVDESDTSVKHVKAYVFADGTTIQGVPNPDGSVDITDPGTAYKASSNSATAHLTAYARTTTAEAATTNAATNVQKADQAKNYQAVIPSGEYAGMPLEVAQFLQSAANDKIMRDHAQGQLDQQAAQQQAMLVNDALNRAMTGRGQDMSQATAYRGQDINSADQRRGQDMTQQNDIMDNNRSLFEAMRPSMVFNPGGYAQLQQTQGQIAAASGQPYTPSSPTPSPFDVTSMGKMIAQSVLGRGGSPSPGFSQEPAPAGS